MTGNFAVEVRADKRLVRRKGVGGGGNFPVDG